MELAGLILFTFLAVLPASVAVFLGLRAYCARKAPAICLRRRQAFLVALAAAAAVYAAVSIDAWFLEPNWPKVEEYTMEGPVAAPLRILHLSDLHIDEKPEPREDWLVRQVEKLRPDVIIITGDIHQLDYHDPAGLARVLGRLHAPLGVFACAGYDDPAVIRAAAPQIVFPKVAPIVISRRGDRIVLRLVTRRAVPPAPEEPGTLRVAMDHKPDLADVAADQGADLFLCGHTHGGQVRIPFWGAIVTHAGTGKRYEAGMYRSGKTWIHVSRGLGLEPRPAQQVRFLCRPEISLIEVRPESQRTSGTE
jgi:uncharacterized protein